MNKKLFPVLVCLLCFALPGMAARAAQDADVIGAWYYNALEVGGASVHPDAIGMTLAIVIDEDGSALYQTPGEADVPAYWTLEDDTLTLLPTTDAYATLVMNLTDGELILEDGSMRHIFGREKAGMEAAKIAPIRAAGALADFDGDWVAVAKMEDGVQIPAALLGIDVTLTISAGRVGASQVTLPDGNIITTQARGELKDGALVIDSALLEMEVPDRTIHLREDGTISFMIDETNALYLERVLAE